MSQSHRFHDRLAVASLALASLLLQIPFLNRGISFYDEGSILAIADGLHNGELLYRDRVTLLPPLTYELMRQLFDLFGPSLVVGRVVQAVVFVLCTLLIYRILRYFMASGGAFLAAIAFLPIKSLAFPFWTVVNYSQLAMLFSLVAVVLTLRFFATRQGVWLLVAATAVGMTVITKQNLGAGLAATVGVAIALDALRERQHVARRLLSRAALLLAGGLPPVVAVAALFAARSTLGDLIQRVILDLQHVSQLIPTPIPVPYGAMDPGDIMFMYFPAALSHLTWSGRLDLLFQPALFVSIGHAVQATYVVPLLALLVACIQLWRGWGSTTMPQGEWSSLALLVAFAATSYASMLYRADWTHLMNIAPPLLLLSGVVVARLVSGTRLAVVLPLTLCTLWLIAGGLAALAVFAAYDVPLDTPRGRVLAERHEADHARQVMSYVERQPATDRILVFRADPLYYFLLDRRIPILLDLVMPALLGPEDDAMISRQLRTVDQVIYNPKRYLTLAMPLTEYAPQTARVLTTDFVVVEALGPTAVVLKRRVVPQPRDVTALDLWNDAHRLRPTAEVRDQLLPAAGGTPAVTPATWMMYRVLGLTLQDRNLWQCVAAAHHVANGESVSVIPMLNPLTWVREVGDPDFMPEASGALFRITVHSATGVDTTLYEAEQPLGVPPAELHLALDRFVDQEVEIRFCAALPPDAPPGRATALAGWAEPRIVRRAGAD